jgi:membrane-associated phospholipid phosphatase
MAHPDAVPPRLSPAPRSTEHAPLRRDRHVDRVVLGLLLASGLGTVVFALLASVAWHSSQVDALDRWVADAALSSHRWLFDLGTAGSFLGSGPVVAVIAGALGLYIWFRAGRPWLGVGVVMAVGGSGALQMVAKHIIERPRPSTAVLSGESGYGFPSGHTTGAAAIAVALVVLAWVVPRSERLTRRGRSAVVAGACVYVAVVATCRVVVGAHYFTDVVAGLAFGVGVSAVVLAAVLWREPTSWREADGATEASR